MSKKNNYYYKNKHNYHKKTKKNNEVKETKVTYDSLMHADIEILPEKQESYNRITIIKYIAITIVLFAIIFGSLLLFRQI